MKLIYEGKTKDVYQLNNGKIQLHFKDDVTGEDGEFDPGADTVGAVIDGVGRANLQMSMFFFEKLNELNIPTHYIDANLAEQTMIVKAVNMFGSGLEVICRFRAVGSFYRRYGTYCKEGEPLNSLVEFTLKDDERNDPLITKDALIQLNILTEEEYERMKQLTVQIAKIVKDTLLEKELELYDIKFEFGRDKKTGEILLIDEISGGNMRVYQKETFIEPLQLDQILFHI